MRHATYAPEYAQRWCRIPATAATGDVRMYSLFKHEQAFTLIIAHHGVVARQRQ